MGIFEKALQEQPAGAAAPLTPHQAFVAVIVGSVSADGSISPEETARINQVFNSTRLFRQPAGEALQPALSAVMGMIQRYGPDGVMPAAARALPAPLRAPAFAIAVDLVLADGEAGPDERQFIDALQRLLEIPEQEAIRIVEVLLIKNSA